MTFFLKISICLHVILFLLKKNHIYIRKHYIVSEIYLFLYPKNFQLYY